MKELAPKGGADSDNYLGLVNVRVGFSYVERNQITVASCNQRSYGKSERGLDLPEAAGRRAEGRASGKSERSERNDGGGRGDHGLIGGCCDE